MKLHPKVTTELINIYYHKNAQFLTTIIINFSIFLSILHYYFIKSLRNLIITMIIIILMILIFSINVFIF